MADLVEELSREARTLPPNDRVRHAEELLATVQEVDPDVESAWDAEIKLRIAEIDRSAATLIPAEEVFAEVRRLIKGSPRDARKFLFSIVYAVRGSEVYSTDRRIDRKLGATRFVKSPHGMFRRSSQRRTMQIMLRRRALLEKKRHLCRERNHPVRRIAPEFRVAAIVLDREAAAAHDHPVARLEARVRGGYAACNR